MVMICDGVVANITSLYLGVIVVIKLFGLLTGRSFSGWFVVAVSTLIVASIFLSALTWDVSRKASYNPPQSDQYLHIGGGGGGGSSGSSNGGSGGGHRCRGGGICWHHGVSVQSTVSQIRFQLPQYPLSTAP